jgi:alpha-methylacyl-CoA racemase
MGALTGIRVVEMAAIGPVPFCGMMLSDMGADVVRIDRLGDAPTPFAVDPRQDVISRGRRSIGVDLKNPAGRELARMLIGGARVVLEGSRPGVMERLGLGPENCWVGNPKLIFGRATGWGQEGDLAARAGHDINYLALAGVLHGIGRKGEPPVPPINLLGDYGGGGMLLTVGVLAALLESDRSGKGQIVDAAMLDGASILQTVLFGLTAMGQWRPERGTNFLDSGCFYYDVYETADGKFMAVGALEAKFFAALLQGLELNREDFPDRENPQRWDGYRQKFRAAFRARTQAAWTKIFADTDACATPVLTMQEATQHAHARERHAFIAVGGITQPGPAPRFSRTASEVGSPPPMNGEHTRQVLQELGCGAAEIERLRTAGAIASAPG